MERLCEIFRHVGNSLDLGETLATLDRELHRLVRYDALSVHLVEGCRIIPAYAAGIDFQILAALEERAGSGLLGRVAATREPALNRVPDRSGRLAMAMAVPLESPVECWDRATAVLALYRLERDPFALEDLRILTMLSLKLAASIDNARRFERVERACARALFERLDAEVARARRAGGRLAILECAVVALDPAGSVADGLAAELRGLCREYDFVARTGDSFVVLLADFARIDLSRKRSQIEEVFLNAGLTATIGAALYPDDGSDAEDLLVIAHAAARGAVHA